MRSVIVQIREVVGVRLDSSFLVSPPICFKRDFWLRKRVRWNWRGNLEVKLAWEGAKRGLFRPWYGISVDTPKEGYVTVFNRHLFQNVEVYVGSSRRRGRWGFRVGSGFFEDEGLLMFAQLPLQVAGQGFQKCAHLVLRLNVPNNVKTFSKARRASGEHPIGFRLTTAGSELFRKPLLPGEMPLWTVFDRLLGFFHKSTDFVFSWRLLLCREDASDELDCKHARLEDADNQRCQDLEAVIETAHVSDPVQNTVDLAILFDFVWVYLVDRLVEFSHCIALNF